ncbi:MAG TPA: LytTR family DNA-binding domain-containing protein [Gemmatimonadaceae bacterium]|nr:LytTR family DNA-binding domain-containing protein [Gemmatimonadaceae bacterium]
MTAIRVVIVDDEPLARRGIRQLLAPHDDVEIVGEARNGKEAVRMLTSLAPDVVFLDVQMPELDGFAVLRQLDQTRLPFVIFVTAYDTFAVRAFEQHALDYLVKPVHEARFQHALARAREQLRSREAVELSRRLSQLLANGAETETTRQSTPARRLVIDTGGAELVLEVAEVVWIEADDYYAAVHARGRRHLIRESLTSLEERLDRNQFVRVHRSAIVNLARVSEIRSRPTGEQVVVLRDGTQLPLSRRRREQVADAIRRFAR